jgi:hypothetical protein
MEEALVMAGQHDSEKHISSAEREQELASLYKVKVYLL